MRARSDARCGLSVALSSKARSRIRIPRVAGSCTSTSPTAIRRSAPRSFPRQAGRLRHAPKEGDLVQVTVERPDFWTARGKLDLIVVEIELAGVGLLLRRRAELLTLLTAQGLCDPARRKPLPQFPRAVGVIAGKGSDGRSDVIRALQDRFPPVHIVTCDALVQGKTAPRDLIDDDAHTRQAARAPKALSHLRLIATIIRILAILVAVLGGLGVIIGTIATLSGDRGVGPALVVLVVGFLHVAVIALFLFAYGEIIRLMIAVEDNTRLTAEALAGRGGNLP